jgi:hypothetical protein
MEFATPPEQGSGPRVAGRNCRAKDRVGQHHQYGTRRGASARNAGPACASLGRRERWRTVGLAKFVTGDSLGNGAAELSARRYGP